jgi:hypothetical protein
MTEKGETKIIAIVTIFIILLSISFSGCFEDDDNKIDTAKESDLELFISMNKTSTKISNRNLLVNVTLSNVKDSPIKIQKSFQVGTWLKVEIISSTNETLEAELIQAELKDEKIVFKANEQIVYIFSIFSIDYLDENGYKYKWEIGNFTIKFRYLFTEPDVISNELQFQIFE